jgi:hypothetical protein
VTHAEFWALVDRSRKKRDQAGELERELAKLPPAEIVEFDAWFWTYYLALARKDVWAAVFAIRAGCSDDGFDYARAWLIGMGEAVVLATVRDPESLAEHEMSVMRHEALMYAAPRAYERACGAKLPEDQAPKQVPDVASWPADRLSDYDWSDDVYRTQFPTLYARYIEPAARAEAAHAIPHAKFWEIIAKGRERAGAGGAAAVAKGISAVLSEEGSSVWTGFTRWLEPYHQALWREDLRDACRVLLGDGELDAFLGFRGWLLAQGEAAVAAAVRDADALAALATDPPVACRAMIELGANRYSMQRPAKPERDGHAIPDAASWPAPRPRLERYTAAALRTRLPKLTAGRRDEELEGPADPRRISEHERKVRAELQRGLAAGCEDPQRAIALLTEALAYLPPRAPAPAPYSALNHLAAECLSMRGRMHARLDAHAAALADFDAALPLVKGTGPIALERAKTLLALGRRDDAIASANAAETPDAKRWLDELAPVKAPRAGARVRHAKFGDGTLVQVLGEKLEIDFGAAGKKTLLAKFVELL